MSGRFAQAMVGKKKSKLGLLIGAAVAALVISIMGGVVGTVANKKQCTERCPTKADSGWMGFSITWFIASILVIVLLFFSMQKGLMTNQGLLASMKI